MITASFDPVLVMRTGAAGLPFGPRGIEQIRQGKLALAIKYGARFYKGAAKHGGGMTITHVEPQITEREATRAAGTLGEFAHAVRRLAESLRAGADQDMLLGDDHFITGHGVPCPGQGSVPGAVCLAAKIIAEGRPVFARFGGLSVTISPIGLPAHNLEVVQGQTLPFDGGGNLGAALGRAIRRLPPHSRARLAQRAGRGGGRSRGGRGGGRSRGSSTGRTYAPASPVASPLAPGYATPPPGLPQAPPPITPFQPGTTATTSGMLSPSIARLLPGAAGGITVGPPLGTRAQTAAQQAALSQQQACPPGMLRSTPMGPCMPYTPGVPTPGVPLPGMPGAVPSSSPMTAAQAAVAAAASQAQGCPPGYLRNVSGVCMPSTPAGGFMPQGCPPGLMPDPMGSGACVPGGGYSPFGPQGALSPFAPLSPFGPQGPGSASGLTPLGPQGGPSAPFMPSGGGGGGGGFPSDGGGYFPPSGGGGGGGGASDDDGGDTDDDDDSDDDVDGLGAYGSIYR